MTFFRQILVLVCAIELALPTGWCCRIDAAVEPSEDSAPAPAPACCCCCPVAQPEPTTSEAADAPRPAAPLACCCKPRQAALQKDIPAGETIGVVYWQTSFAVAVSMGSPQRSADFVPILSPPLHLLHSVWLC